VSPFGRNLLNVRGIQIKNGEIMTALNQTPGHVCAHSAETHEPKLHVHFLPVSLPDALILGFVIKLPLTTMLPQS
jgi:hypothetical protein